VAISSPDPVESGLARVHQVLVDLGAGRRQRRQHRLFVEDANEAGGEAGRTHQPVTPATLNHRHIDRVLSRQLRR
jgi:hypothetical protein